MDCCFMFGRRSQHAVEGDEGEHSVRVFSYNELRKATQDFSGANKIGEGGFGSVFRGMLKDGTLIAVKVLSATSRQGVREFLTELTAISDIKHENLVTLVGCCAEGSHRILVYNYLEKNSLSQTLLGSGYSSIQFNWRARVKIAVGVARGLAFLHEEIRPHIIHRDIKASNILLDKDLTPKISDFGLARLLPANATHVSTRVAGTLGYLAPEYAIRGQVTKKSDIYSYGVLLLEIVSGRCNTNTRLPCEDQFLLEKTWAFYEQERLEEIIDADIDEDLDIEEACRFLKIGLLCTQDAMARRPHMPTVVRMLTGSKSISMEKITRPAMITDFAELKVSTKPHGANQARLQSSLVLMADMGRPAGLDGSLKARHDLEEAWDTVKQLHVSLGASADGDGLSVCSRERSGERIKISRNHHVNLPILFSPQKVIIEMRRQTDSLLPPPPPASVNLYRQMSERELAGTVQGKQQQQGKLEQGRQGTTVRASGDYNYLVPSRPLFSN
uniref:Putative LRR receptor-like serine/threonine-protein kinase n=1 Tax=Aegilops tauschii TaxID=37682 RepID=N1R2C9_AEGTA